MNSLRVFCLLWLLFTLGRCSCNPEPSPNDQLPAETQEGKNTFGCRVNGEVWLPRNSFGFPPIRGLLMSYNPLRNGGFLDISASRWYYDTKDSISTSEGIVLEISPLANPGQYSLNTTAQAGTAAYYAEAKQTDQAPFLKYCQYGGDRATCLGSLTITKLDSSNHILAGHFEFTLTMKDSVSNCPRVIKVTDGRFDMKF